MAKGEAQKPGENVSIKLEGLRVRIERAVEQYPACLKYQDVHDRVVAAALTAADDAADKALKAIEAKAAAFVPFEL